MTMCINQQHLNTLPGDQSEPLVSTPAFYTDVQCRDWQYWPISAAEDMWPEVTCNQWGCDRPAAFVGVADVLGDGILYFDSAAAWCYWCMPREAMTAESEHMARHAEWARRQTVEDCIGLVNRIWDEARDSDTIDSPFDRLISNIRSATETREQVLAYSILPPQYLDGRPHTSEQVYAARQVGNSAAVPEDESALELRSGNHLSVKI